LNKLGKYELIQELGRGAMGVVYRARDPIINRLVALKTIIKGVAEDPDLLQRFYREAQSAGGLQHPNIVTIYDMGEEGGTPYIAMELVEGESLEQLIARRAPLPLSLKLTYAIQAGSALDYAHKRGIIHRDIKPGNIMLNKEGTVKVVDFGIARVLQSSKTQTGMLIGTFAYMAPEQYHGEHADERSDLWSFGVLLYELVCYQRPFRGDSAANLMHSICSQDPAPARDVAADCTQELDKVLSKVLQKSPADRYQTMEDVLLELDPICKGLQSATVAKLVEQSQELVQQGDYPQARDVLRQALQVESTNSQARSLLDKVNVELRRILIRPQAQGLVQKGLALLEEGRFQEAREEVENALRLDPSFEAAQELQQRLQQELDRSQLVSQYLQATKLRLAEGLPEEAEHLLSKVLELEPSNKSAKVLQEQVIREKAERERRIRLLDTMQQARSLWTLQKYGECIRLLSELQPEFPHEEEILRLLETAREEQAEQGRRQSLEKARNLLAAGRHEECTALIIEIQKQFPSDDELALLLDEVHQDQANQRRLQGLGEARRLLAGRRCDECISLLTRLLREFPADTDIAKLLESAREVEVSQRRQQQVAKARKLLGARRYEECNLLLADLRKQFPQDEQIANLISALRDEESEQRKLHDLAEARHLLATRHYDESIALLAKLQQEYPEDDDVARLVATVRSEQAEQRKLQVVAAARNLLAQRRYDECINLVTDLHKSYPEEGEIRKLLETASREQSEQQRQAKLAEARAFLAAGRLADAQALLESLQNADPPTPSVQKLLALVKGEQEKQGKAERLMREWKVLKELVDEKKYPEVIARAEKLLIDFPGDADLARLIEFSRTQQTQVDHEQLLNKAYEKIKALSAANRFQDARQGAQEALKVFPGNKDLSLLQEQAELQERKFQTRKAIEQRIRDIKVKINRENFSEAIELAKQTLVTLGPDSGVTQLLSSALVEFESRENKRKQEQELASIRLLVESGKLDEAAQVLQHAVETQILESFDSRVGRVSDEIDAARNRSSAPSAPGPEPKAPGPGFSKEYAWQVWTPSPVAPDLAEPNSQTQIAPAQASAHPPVVSGPPAASPPPTVVEVPAPPVVKPVTPGAAPPPADPLARTVINKPDEASSIPLAPLARFQPRPSAAPPPVAVPAPQRGEIPFWRQPAAVAIAAMVLVMIWGLVHFISVNRQKKVVPITAPKHAQAQPQVTPMELQFKAMDAADKKRAAGDFAGASRALQDAASLNGPLNGAIQKRMDAIQAEMKDERLGQLRQQEEQLWQSAKSDIDRGQFLPAEKSLNQILALPEGGLRRDDAKKYLDQTIPRRKEEEALFAQAKRALRKKDQDSLNRTAALLDRVIQFEGPRKTDAIQLRETVQNDLNTLQKQQRDQQIASLGAGARLDAKQRDFSSARQKVNQIRQAGGDTTSLSAEIDQAEAAEQTQRQYEANYQQTLQKYKQALAANDKNGVDAARASFLLIAQGGGSHANDASKYLSEINSRATAPPVAPPPPPVAKQDLRSAKPQDEAAVREVMHRYEQAFQQQDIDALRAIWPGIGNKRYDKLKNSFKSDIALHVQVKIEVRDMRVEINPDGQRATIAALFFQKHTLKGGESKSRQDQIVYELSKTNGIWVITNVQ
jgi:eukaryotic-like serine/threonine-protein kinase